MSFIQVNQLTKKFNDKIVLDHIDIQIAEGAITTLLGPSGCGKSTLLRSIAGLHPIDEGEIYIGGQRIDQLPPKDRGIGMVFQNYALFPNMTAAENIAFGLTMKKVSRDEQRRKVAEMIDIVGLKGKEQAYPRQLSGGQQQRVALARALVTEPAVLLLDEPLSALDAQIRKHLQNLLIDIQQRLNITMILVTHDQEEAMALSDYVYIMKDGLIAQQGEPNSIYKNPDNEFIAKFIGSYNVMSCADFSQLTGEKYQQTEFVAIRPETLSVEPVADAYQLTGHVVKEAMLGSIIRYDIEINQHIISIDRLNRSINLLPVHQPVTIYLSKEDIIQINRGA